jgi:hypothetical protein
MEVIWKVPKTYECAVCKVKTIGALDNLYRGDVYPKGWIYGYPQCTIDIGGTYEGILVCSPRCQDRANDEWRRR